MQNLAMRIVNPHECLNDTEYYRVYVTHRQGSVDRLDRAEKSEIPMNGHWVRNPDLDHTVGFGQARSISVACGYALYEYRRLTKI